MNPADDPVVMDGSQKPFGFGVAPLAEGGEVLKPEAFNALPEAASLAAANKRVSNILKKVEGSLPTTISDALLKEAAEQALAIQLKALTDKKLDRKAQKRDQVVRRLQATIRKYKGRIAIYDYYLPVMGLAAMSIGKKTSELTEADLPALKEVLQKMKATPDGDGSLLDHSVYLYGSGMGNPLSPLPPTVV